ncbi:MAG: hypothetical protein HQK91_13895 [Nitrospirae bacterium]|nr:hypothetical protein [Nitrospirota bacterium]MBF0542529.1 hypothetical protein [Nitrospirota bacterium]
MGVIDDIIEQQLEPLNEMATVGYFDNKYQISIYPEPLGNPSFHLRCKEWEVVLKINDFTVLEVTSPFNKGTKLPNRIMKKLMQFLNSKHELGTTNWKFLLATWNSNNPKYKVDLIEIPKI